MTAMTVLLRRLKLQACPDAGHVTSLVGLPKVTTCLGSTQAAEEHVDKEVLLVPRAFRPMGQPM